MSATCEWTSADECAMARERSVAGTAAAIPECPEHPDRLPLESCVCGQCFDCPDGWHREDQLPCSCTADCALEAG